MKSSRGLYHLKRVPNLLFTKGWRSLMPRKYGVVPWIPLPLMVHAEAKWFDLDRRCSHFTWSPFIYWPVTHNSTFYLTTWRFIRQCAGFVRTEPDHPVTKTGSNIKSDWRRSAAMVLSEEGGFFCKWEPSLAVHARMETPERRFPHRSRLESINSLAYWTIRLCLKAGVWSWFRANIYCC